MSGGRVLQQFLNTARQHGLPTWRRQTPRRIFPNRTISTSPFYRLFARHLERSSVRHLLFRGTRRPYSAKYNPTPNLNSPSPSGAAGKGASSASTPEAPLSLSQRLRKLSREYGWSAFGVYMALSALDFPFCFLAVRSLGTERVGQWEHAIVEWARRAVPIQIPEKWGGKSKAQRDAEARELTYDHGVKEADEANQSETASLWTQLALAYAVHKSFIFLRVPLTAAVLPKVVKTLRGWGYNIGKLTPKAEREARKAQLAAQKAAESAAKKAREAQKMAD